MTTMIERVARGIHAHYWSHYVGGELAKWEDLSEVDRAWSLKMARAAISTMHEPTVDMQFAAGSVEMDAVLFLKGDDGQPVGGSRVNMTGAADIWRAMIDKALEVPAKDRDAFFAGPLGVQHEPAV